MQEKNVEQNRGISIPLPSQFRCPERKILIQLRFIHLFLARRAAAFCRMIEQVQFYAIRHRPLRKSALLRGIHSLPLYIWMLFNWIHHFRHLTEHPPVLHWSSGRGLEMAGHRTRTGSHPNCMRRRKVISTGGHWLSILL